MTLARPLAPWATLLTLFVLPACALERLEDRFEAQGLTYNTTDAQDSDTAADTTTDTTTQAAAGTTADTTVASAGADEGASSGTSTLPLETTTAMETTGGPQPVCGNGVLEDFGALPEECDDGNQIADDGCDASCSADQHIFVSSILYQAGDIKGLYLADAKCANMAVQAGFPRPLKFRAWLSDSSTHARDRFKPGRGRIVLVNGQVVADSWIALIAGVLRGPIELTEEGEVYHGGVWTGTGPWGELVPGATNCDDWSSKSSKKFAYYGYSDRTTEEWTLSVEDDNPYPCGGDFALYCLEGR